MTIKALTFVDDILSTSRKPKDAYISNKNVEWFSDKKRLHLNEPKCLQLGVNLKGTDIIPRLKIGDTVLENVNCAKYLGDQFNSAGTNKDLVEERVKKGQSCLINSMSLCSEVTMGMFTIQTLMLLYRSLLLQVVLSDAQAWSNLTNQNIQDLQVIQLKYLKRMMHTPPSTPTPFVFLETGTLPIEYEIHIKQFTFLHHILTLDHDDPLRITYYEQLKYPFEPNWGNEMAELRSRYGVTESDDNIIVMSKDRWKGLVKSRVYQKALSDLTPKASCQKWSTSVNIPSKLECKEYLSKLPSENARMLFQIRAGTVDLRSVRKYLYDNNKCRLCDADEENVEHVINECPSVSRQYKVTNVYDENLDQMLEISKRCVEFNKQIKELDQDLVE